MYKIHLFETQGEFTEEYQSNYSEPWVGYTRENESCSYNKTYEEFKKSNSLNVSKEYIRKMNQYVNQNLS